MVMKDQKRTTFPALRCEMGDWIYYVTFLRFSDIDLWIKRTDEIHKSEKLRDLIQREIRSRVNPVVDYLIEQNERFFNAIVVGVYGGAPQWYPIDVGDSPVIGPPNLDEDSRASIGLLRFEGEEKLFAIDGQHRVVAIKKALGRTRKLRSEEICALFVPHGTDEDGMRRTRRLFSTLNRYAVPVSKGEIVALSEDDAFAIVTRRLVEEFPLLKSGMKGEGGFVHFGTTAPLPTTDRAHLTSLLALYDITTNIHVPFLDTSNRRQMEKMKHRRPPDATLNSIYKEQTRYWKLLVKNFPEYQELFNSTPEEHIAGKYRTPNGGHLMFRPAGQQAFARATRVMMDRGISMSKAVEDLSWAPMDLSSKPWLEVFWNPSTQRINYKASKSLLDSLLLHYAGQSPKRSDYNLLEEYRKVLGNPTATLRIGKFSN
jgi:DNA sulfur modification protein DndB